MDGTTLMQWATKVVGMVVGMVFGIHGAVIDVGAYVGSVGGKKVDGTLVDGTTLTQ